MKKIGIGGVLIQQKQLIIAVDGHDGSGKTTISRLLAEKMGGKYLKPFNGTVGDLMFWAYKKGKHDFLEELSFYTIESAIEDNFNESILVFDRHWLTVSAMVSPKIEKRLTKPITFLCWASIETTMERLIERNDMQENDWDNQKFIDLYYSIAKKNHIPIIDTSSSPEPIDIVNNILSTIAGRERGIEE